MIKLKKLLAEQKQLSEMAATSKRIYNPIADGIKEMDVPPDCKKKFCELLADIFQENPRFDRARFFTASGVSGMEQKVGSDDLPF